jgi:putative ABC transport system substrate-binding protein
MTGDIPYYEDLHNAFMAKLRHEGHAKKTEVIVQKPYPDSISLSNAARKFIAMDVDAIVAYGAPAALAVINEKTKIPLIYASVYEPFLPKVKSRYSTGVYAKLSISSLLRYLRGLKQITTLGVVYSSNEEDSAYQLMELSKLAAQHGIKIEPINLKRHQEAKEKLAVKKLDAVFLTGSSVAHMAMGQVVEYAKEQRVPYASFLLGRDVSAIISLAVSPREQGEKASDKVIKVLGGIPPDKIRAESSTEVELIFNLKEATAMGWKMPMDLVTEATRLIR